MKLDRAGRFMARVVNRSLTFSSGGCLQLGVKYVVYMEQTGTSWIECPAADTDGYHMLTKLDGSLNSVTCDQVRASLAWTGNDPMVLDTMPLPEDHAVQITVDWEADQNNVNKLKVKYIDPADSDGGGLKRASAEDRKAMAANFGQAFRAKYTQGAAAPRPAGAPVAPKPAGPPRPTAAPASVVATKETAWNAFINSQADTSRKPEGQKFLTNEWFRIIDELFKGTTADALLPAQWAEFIEKAPGMVIPF